MKILRVCSFCFLVLFTFDFLCADVRVRMSSLTASDVSFEEIIAAVDANKSRKERLKRMSLNRVEVSPTFLSWVLSGDFEKLERLRFNNCGIMEIPVGGPHVSKIKVLRIEKCELKDVSGLRLYSALQELSLFDVGINQVPEVIVELNNLVALDISSNGALEFSPVFREMKNLEEVCISYNKSIGAGLEYLPLSIKRLAIDGASIEMIPSFFCDFKNLEKLSLSSNRLTESSLEPLRGLNLKLLDLSNNKISEFPKIVLDLKDIEYLDLSHNQIAELPSELWLLANLKFLGLMGTSVTPMKMGLPNDNEIRRELEKRTHVVLPEEERDY